jgi:hypothetical protein
VDQALFRGNYAPVNNPSPSSEAAEIAAVNSRQRGHRAQNKRLIGIPVVFMYTWPPHPEDGFLNAVGSVAYKAFMRRAPGPEPQPEQRGDR